MDNFTPAGSGPVLDESTGILKFDCPVEPTPEIPRPFAMIEGIFFARFLPQEGTKVVHQSPPGCVVPEPDVDKPRLFDFETIAEYIIPRQAFCNRYITICDPDNKYRILGHPVCIKDEKYERNEFMFNFCIVIKVDVDKAPFEAVVRKLANTFTEMEIQDQFLSQEDASKSKDRLTIAALLENIREDLNFVDECMISVDDATTINMKLFATPKYPPPVKSWHVPIFKVKVADKIDDSWDLTMKKLVEHIDGVKDVRRIARNADVALDLTKEALRHFMYRDCIMMLDLFLFGNIYAPTAAINDFIDNKEGMQDECANYVYIYGQNLGYAFLYRLFTSFCTSRTIKEWLKLHKDQGIDVFQVVDVRRLVQFGVIKGLLYRVYKYAVSSQYLASLVTGQSCQIEGGDVLQKYTDGCHSFDQIGVEKNMGDDKVMDQLRKFPKGDVEILYR